MKRAHISEGHQGQHPNAVSGAVKVTAASTAETQGKSVARTHDAEHGVLVMDSPPYVPPVLNYCQATRTDGKECTNVINPGDTYCFGHRAGRGAIRG